MRGPLAHRVDTLQGIGPVSAKALAKKGIETLSDLIWFLPIGYDDQRQVVPIPELVPGERQVSEGVVRSVNFRRGGKGPQFEARLEPLEGAEQGHYAYLKLIWFRAMPGLNKRFTPASKVRVVGKASDFRGVITMAHPELVSEVGGAAIVPRYSVVPGVSGRTLVKAMASALDRVGVVFESAVPADLQEELELMSLLEALRKVHFPPSDLPDEIYQSFIERCSEEHQRIAFEELFCWELTRQQQLACAKVNSAIAVREECADGTLVAGLPFKLTAAQERSLAEVQHDLRQARPMRRLLQGDVGSGKTAIAWLAAAEVAQAGGQVAFLAPTELLAEQHYETLCEFNQEAGVSIRLLTGTRSPAERRNIEDGMLTGAVSIVVGTHAVLGSARAFERLALVIVDEEHRFGVAQRTRLLGASDEHVPHLLVMTATPIPRSLAQVLYIGMDVSLLDELPPGRLPALTRMLEREQREQLWRQVRRAIEADGCVYMVCPAIETSESLRGVDELYEEARRELGQAKVGLVHGGVDAQTRREMMARFQEGVLRVLVTTTLIEVGVDVPKANLIVVEQADRFGLAQLHQLRGRVGRAGQKSACVLLHEALNELGRARLEVMCATHNGFEIAEKDLELRGPGELYGLRQSGLSGFRFSDLRRDLPILEEARKAAERVLKRDPEAGFEVGRGSIWA